MSKAILNECEVNYNACVAMMDDEIREERHFDKYGEEFAI